MLVVYAYVCYICQNVQSKFKTSISLIQWTLFTFMFTYVFIKLLFFYIFKRSLIINPFLDWFWVSNTAPVILSLNRKKILFQSDVSVKNVSFFQSVVIFLLATASLFQHVPKNKRKNNDDMLYTKKNFCFLKIYYKKEKNNNQGV